MNKQKITQINSLVIWLGDDAHKMIKPDFVNIMNIFLCKFLTQLDFKFCILITGYKGLTKTIFTYAHMILLFVKMLCA